MLSNQREISRSLYLLAFLAILPLSTHGIAIESPLWGSLEPGPYGIGFMTIEKYDYSRTLNSATDYYGNSLGNETARPIQACIWYPGDPSVEGPRMVYGEYAFPAPEDDRFFSIVSNLQQRELGISFSMLANDQALVHDAMNVPMEARRDAVPAEGKFPILIVHPDFRGGYCQGVILCEYLASQGFVVVTTHPLGAATIAMTDSPVDIESGIRDREFAVALARDISFVDASFLGVIGLGAGGTAALLHSMRNHDVDVVALLNPSLITDASIENLTESVYYDPDRVRTPLLCLYANESGTADLAPLETLKYSDRHSLLFNSANAFDFSVYGLMAGLASTTNGTSAPLHRNSESICSSTLTFLQGAIGEKDAGGPDLFASEDDLITASFLAAAKAAPSSAQFTNIVTEYGIDEATSLSEKFDLFNPNHPLLSGPAITALGYRFLQRGIIEDALVFFKWGVTAYPNSANAWDSYGEACAASGNNELALTNYRRCLEILPSDSTINPALRDAIQTNAPGIIERLEQLISEQSGPTDTESD